MSRVLLFPMIFFMPFIIYGQSFDCDQIYNEAKEKFDKNFGDASSVNYSTLGKVIFDNLDMIRFTEKNIALYLDHVTEYCPVGVRKNPCKQFSDTAYRFKVKELWIMDYVRSLQSIARKDIIPIPENRLLNDEKSVASYHFDIKDLKKGYEKLSKELTYYFNVTNDTPFYYLTYNKAAKPLIITRTSRQNIFSNTDTLQTSIKQPNSKEIQVIFEFLNASRKNYIQTYKYIDNTWKLVESKNTNN